MSADPPRLLAQRSEHGYTNHTYEALNHEPEAVPADTQAAFTHTAQGRDTQWRRETWLEQRRHLESAIVVLTATFGSTIANELRGFRRELDRLNRKLAVTP